MASSPNEDFSQKLSLACYKLVSFSVSTQCRLVCTKIALQYQNLSLMTVASNIYNKPSFF